VGAFGVGVGSAALLLRWVALAALRPGVLLLGGLWCLSRTGMAIVSRTQPYARGPGGLAAAFEGPARLGLLAAGLAGAFALACGWRLAAGAAAAAAGLAAGGLVVLFARRRIGGYTGDVLGALGVVAETAGLIVAAAKW
jgi:adenosylcobinamide-GDP ribazoletransferase